MAVLEAAQQCSLPNQGSLQQPVGTSQTSLYCRSKGLRVACSSITPPPRVASAQPHQVTIPIKVQFLDCHGRLKLLTMRLIHLSPATRRRVQGDCLFSMKCCV